MPAIALTMSSEWVVPISFADEANSVANNRLEIFDDIDVTVDFSDASCRRTSGAGSTDLFLIAIKSKSSLT